MLPRKADFGELCPLAPITMTSDLSDFAKVAIAFTMSLDTTIFLSNSIQCLAAAVLACDMNSSDTLTRYCL